MNTLYWSRNMKIRTSTISTAFLLASFVFAASAKAADQKTFATPEQAVQALVKASQDGNQDEMLAVFGDAGKELVFSGDSVQDKASMQRFVKSYETKHVLVRKDGLFLPDDLKPLNPEELKSA